MVSSEVEVLLKHHPSLIFDKEKQKVKCSLTKHEMPITVQAIESYVKGKKYKKASKMSDFSLDKKDEKHIVPSNKKNHLHEMFCTLTLRHVAKTPEAIQRHITGRKYTNALARWTKCKETGERFVPHVRRQGKTPRSLRFGGKDKSGGPFLGDSDDDDGQSGRADDDDMSDLYPDEDDDVEDDEEEEEDEDDEQEEEDEESENDLEEEDDGEDHEEPAQLKNKTSAKSKKADKRKHDDEEENDSESDYDLGVLDSAKEPVDVKSNKKKQKKSNQNGVSQTPNSQKSTKVTTKPEESKTSPREVAKKDKKKKKRKPNNK